MPKLIVDGELSARLADLRRSLKTFRELNPIMRITSLTQEERADLERATGAARLRYSSSVYWPKRWQTTYFAVGIAILVATWLALPVLAFLEPRGYLSVPLSAGTWACFALGWLAYLQPSLAGTIRGRVLETLFFSVIILGVLASGRSSSLLIRHDVTAALLGYTVCLATPRVIRSLGSIVELISTVRGRYRASDAVVLELTTCAVAAWSALTGTDRYRLRWNDPGFAQYFIWYLRTAASEIEKAPRLSRRTKWTQPSLRSAEDAPYHAVAAVLRSHVPLVVTAKSQSDWQRVCQSLASGAIAAARNDWAALLVNAPAGVRLRRSSVIQTLRRLVPAAVLAASGLLLPIWIPIGAYGPSVRALLIVNAALSLLPRSAAVGDTVTGVLAKALPFRN